MVQVDDRIKNLFRMAAHGDPYFIMVEDGDAVQMAISKTFNLGALLNFILAMADEETDPENKEILANFVIDMSKKI